PKLFDLVPVFVPLGWFMMAYAAHDLATLITGRGILCKGRPEYPLLWILWPSLVAAGAMTAWDLVMEPQMVATKHWVWVEGGDYFGIPVRNFIGWLVTMLIVYVSYRS
ncbi:MAG: carotenoid biosynthesis protein, partial [Anaerolineae bacterium]|nr:carotenoid biosynthesis protein [Anaerolineae bacterium]